MHRLAEVERFEEAAATADRLATLTQVLQRAARVDALRGAERLVIDSDEGRTFSRWSGRARPPDDGVLDLNEVPAPDLTARPSAPS